MAQAKYKACRTCGLHVSHLLRGEPCPVCEAKVEVLTRPASQVWFSIADARAAKAGKPPKRKRGNSRRRNTGFVGNGSRRVASAGKRNDSADQRTPGLQSFEWDPFQ